MVEEAEDTKKEAMVAVVATKVVMKEVTTKPGVEEAEVEERVDTEMTLVVMVTIEVMETIEEEVTMTMKMIVVGIDPITIMVVVAVEIATAKEITMMMVAIQDPTLLNLNTEEEMQSSLSSQKLKPSNLEVKMFVTLET